MSLRALTQTLIIEYDSSKGGRTKRKYHPYKICYSARDDKFRLMCAAFNRHHNELERITLNLGRATSILMLKRLAYFPVCSINDGSAPGITFAWIYPP